MRKFLASLIESIPLTFFLVYIQCVEIKVSHDWLLPYLLASIAAVLSTAYLLWKGVVLNRLIVGINLYFFSGLVGLVFGWVWLNQLYGELRGLGMLYWIFAVGCVSSCYGRFGFLGVESTARLSLAHWLLLFMCIPALAMAMYFSGNSFWGEWFPFIFLFFMRGLLRQHSLRAAALRTAR